MNDWYQVLGVAPSATRDEIAAAFARLVPEERDATESEDESEERKLREYAFAVLSDPDRRAAYDAERTPEPDAANSLAGGRPPRSPRSGGLLAPLIGALGILFALAAVAAVAFLIFAKDDDEGSRFPAREDDDVDLAAMRLRNVDLPPGFSYSDSVDFSNEEWAQLFFNEEELADPEGIEEDVQARLRELEAEGRLRNLLSVYQSSELGRTLGIFSVSTLYTDDTAASRSLDLFCGLPVDERRNLESRPLALPTVGDETSGFIADGVMSSELYKETTFCFRTGRIVHAISLASLPGIEDISLAVRLAHRMEHRVEDFYAGIAPPEDKPSEDEEEG